VDASTVTFSNIPRTLKTITIDISARQDGTGASFTNLQMQVGGDTGSFYQHAYTFGQGSTAAGQNSTGTQANVGYVPQSFAGQTNMLGSTTVKITDWDLANSRASGLQFHFQGFSPAATVSNSLSAQGGGLYTGTQALTSITFKLPSGKFKAGSVFRLNGYT